MPHGDSQRFALFTLAKYDIMYLHMLPVSPWEKGLGEEVHPRSKSEKFHALTQMQNRIFFYPEGGNIQSQDRVDSFSCVLLIALQSI
jgi:hypothetical protein